MSVSIIIPAFNAERYLASTLDSLRKQTAGDWEAIVVNDGSGDATAEIAERYGRMDGRIRVTNQNNRGPGESRNVGLAEADGARGLALFLDADDLLEPNALESLGDELAKFPDAPAVHGMGRYISGEGEERPELGVFPKIRSAITSGGKTAALGENAPTERGALVVKNCILSPGAALIRKNALAAVGEWNPKFSGVEDLDMWYRLAGIGPIPFLRRVVLAYRVHAGSLSNQRENMRRAMLMVRQEWLVKGNAEERRLVKAGYQEIVRQGARRRVSKLISACTGRQWTMAAKACVPAVTGVAKMLPGASDAFLFWQGWRLGAGRRQEG